jgi:hypothetical protein
MRRALSVLALGCVGCLTTSTERTVAETSALEPERTLSFERGGEPFPEEPAWKRGQSLDPVDLGQLGRQEGATRLVELAERGGKTGALALFALAEAPDARAERARACELLADIRLEERPLVLRAVHRLLTEAPPLFEELAPGADATCAAQLRPVLSDSRAAPVERDLAESALASLAGP